MNLVEPNVIRSESIGSLAAKSGWSPSAFSEREFSEKPDRKPTQARFVVTSTKNWAKVPSERFLEVDEMGRVKHTGLTTKSQLCDRFGLKFGALRAFDSRTNQCSISPHGPVLIFNIFNLRALLTADSVTIFDELLTTGPTPSDGRSSSFLDRPRLMHNLGGIHDQLLDEQIDDFALKSAGLAYEFKVLGCLLDAVCASLAAEFSRFKSEVINVVDGLDAHIDSEGRKALLLYSYHMPSLIERIERFHDYLEAILNNDIILKQFHLTHRQDGSPDLEILLESFLRYLEDLIGQTHVTKIHIKTAGDTIELNATTMHNTLTALDIKVAIMTCGVGGAALVGGIFGMNLKTDIEEAPYAFLIVITLAAFLATSGIVYGYMMLDKVMKRSETALPRLTLGAATVVPINRQ